MKNSTLSILLLFSLFASDLAGADIKQKNSEQRDSEQHQQWLKDKFAAQHQALIPVVTVADMFRGCNLVRKTDPVDYQVKDLVMRVSREQLAEKLSLCLGADSPKSDTAINFALRTCFAEQFKTKPSKEQQQKLLLVEQLLAKLPRKERQQSLIKCVTDQTIQYLK